MPAEKPNDNLHPAGVPVMSWCRRGVRSGECFLQSALEYSPDVGGPSS